MRRLRRWGGGLTFVVAAGLACDGTRRGRVPSVFWGWWRDAFLGNEGAGGWVDKLQGNRELNASGMRKYVGAVSARREAGEVRRDRTGGMVDGAVVGQTGEASAAGEAAIAPAAGDVDRLAEVGREGRWRARVRVGWRWVRVWAGPAAVVGVYLWVALHFFPNHRYQVNPDGIGYLSVAGKYLRGDFADAVNAYWSPLYSWLLVPLLAVGVEGLTATKVLGMLTGGATLAAMWWVLRRSGCPRDVSTLACAAAVPGVVWAAYCVITPDLLVACVLLYYLASFCHPAQATRPMAAVRLGLLAGLAYLAKAYALPFVLGHFAVVRGVELIRGGGPGMRRRLLVHSVLTLVSMAVVVGLWSSVLTAKFGYFTTGSTGRYNLLINAPNSPGQVMHWAGLVPPPDEHAISLWDDVTDQVHRMPDWDPLATAADRAYLWGKVQGNFWKTLEVMERQTAWLYALLVVVLLTAGTRADLRPRWPGFILAAALVLYPVGYFVLHVEERFLVILPLLVLMGAAYAIARAGARGLMNGWWRRDIAVAVVGLTFLWHPLEMLGKQRNSAEGLMRQAEALREVLPAGAKVASAGNWAASLYLSYFLDLRYHGETRGDRGRLLAQAAEQEVEYLLIWRHPDRALGRAEWERVGDEASKRVAIYRRVAAATMPGAEVAR